MAGLKVKLDPGSGNQQVCPISLSARQTTGLLGAAALSQVQLQSPGEVLAASQTQAHTSGEGLTFTSGLTNHI